MNLHDEPFKRAALHILASCHGVGFTPVGATQTPWRQASLALAYVAQNHPAVPVDTFAAMAEVVYAVRAEVCFAATLPT